MISDVRSHHMDDQPGLEVNHQSGLEVDNRYTAAPESEGLQPVPYQDEPKPYPHGENVAPLSTPGSYYNGYDPSTPGAQTAALSNYDGQHYQGPAAAGAAAPKHKRKLIWIIAAVVAVLVIIGAVLGGVLGSRAAKGTGNSGADSTSDSGSGSNVTALTNIRSTSSLAVSGWRDGDNYRIRLFYQGQDQKLRMSTYASNESSWSDPVSLTGLEYAASANTSLAASCTVEGNPVSRTSALELTVVSRLLTTLLLRLNIN
jgi:hypothetical protein